MVDFFTLLRIYREYMVRTTICALDERCPRKTVQELLRHAKVQTTLDLYSQSMPAERMVAQGNMLTAIFGHSTPAEN
jgi:hypothetical protein